MVNIRSTSYYPGNSILHTTGTLTKVLLATLFIFASAMGGKYSLLTIALVCHFGMLISGIPISEAWKRLAAMKTFLLFFGGVPLLLTPGTRVQLFDLFVLPVTVEGSQLGFFTVSRIALMIWISMMLVWTTSPESLIKIVAEFGSKFFPKSKFLQEFFLVGVLAFQTLPYFFIRAEKEIGKVLKEQGKNRKEINLLKKMKEMVRSLIMWTVTVLTEPYQFIDRQKKR